jgi:hypothetical protein
MVMSSGNWWKKWLGSATRHATGVAWTAPQRLRESAGDLVARRLREIAIACVDGRVPQATLDLVEWCRESGCPASARVLLASLYMRQGRNADARKVVGDVVDIAGTLSLLDRAQLCIEIIDHPHRAHAIAQSWCEAMSLNGPQAAWVRDLSGLDTREHEQREEACVRQLAEELMDHIHVVPTLVAAQMRDQRDDELRVLRAALRMVLRELGEEHANAQTLVQAIAQLADIAGDSDESQRWAHRGLARNPYSATLALLLANVADNPAIGPPARELLARAAEANPTYPDLRAACIRRTARDGRRDEAATLLNEWATLQPDHPMVGTLRTELAA